MFAADFWVFPLINQVDFAIFLICFVVVVVALVHCALQRSDAFAAVDTMPKATWLLIIAGAALLSLFLAFLSTLFALIALAAALIYLLDVRPAIREITNGRW